MKPTILIVDDDEEIRTQMKWALADEYEIATAEDRCSALKAFRSADPDVTLLDLGLPPMPNDPEEGMATLEELLQMDPTAKVIIASGQGDRKNAIRAVGSGAFDFHIKPVDMEELRLILKRCIQFAELEREYLEIQNSVQAHRFEGILGTSPIMRNVFSSIRKVAQSSAPVLILGESGTGKELVANAIHGQSDRSDQPFLALNCTAIPENLIESELFGHEKGAFTGADSRREGLIEGAAGGTLFLDEVGDLPGNIQVKLLRFLQERRFLRVGGREEMSIDTRIVAATHVDLDEAMSAGKFREDLYFRLAVVNLRLPPLRERGEDLTLLAQEFLQSYSAENGKKGLRFAPQTLRGINQYQWPGNVREMQNRIHRAVVMAEKKRITVSDLELEEVAEALPPMTIKEAREETEREMIQQAMLRTGGNMSNMAAELGVTRPTLYELMNRLKISRT